MFLIHCILSLQILYVLSFLIVSLLFLKNIALHTLNVSFSFAFKSMPFGFWKRFYFGFCITKVYLYWFFLWGRSISTFAQNKGILYPLPSSVHFWLTPPICMLLLILQPPPSPLPLQKKEREICSIFWKLCV